MVLTDNLPGSSFGNASQFYFNVRWGGREISKKKTCHLEETIRIKRKKTYSHTKYTVKLAYLQYVPIPFF